MAYEYKKPKLVASKDLYHLTQSHIELAPSQVLPIKFPFLTDFMMGILRTELLLVGAKTGSGKTQFLTELALQWSRMGKRVAFIALEAEPEEIEQRILYKILCKFYLNDPKKVPGVYLDFRRWRFGMLETVFAPYKGQAEIEFQSEVKNLHCHYMQKAEFTIIDLVDLMDDIEKSCDVCIVDHLHYFDLIGSTNDMMGMKQLMKRIREINLKSGVPFVMAAHLRKDLQCVMPTVDDFMGSSDIPKIATSAILLAPKPDGYKAKDGTMTTLFSVPKLRGGGASRVLAEIDYSISHQMYLPLYTLSTLSAKGDKLYAIEKENWPRWARSTEDQWSFDY
jgi:hypothetical protein